MITVQTFNRADWPPNSTIDLQDDAAAALLTAGRDYEAEKHTSLHGDYLAAPVGGDRTLDEVVEMREAWRAPRSSALWRTIGRGKYNMDPGSRAIPSLTSPHLRGECMDISNNGFLAWLIVNGKRYGLVRTLVAENDLRHFQFFPGTATVALDVTSLDDSAQPIRRRDAMDLIRVSSQDNSYTEAILTDYVHTKVVTPEFARNVMYCRKDIADKVNGFDAVVAQSNYDELKALPSFVDAGGAQIDEVALASTIVTALGSSLASDADLEAAKAAIIAAIPTGFVAARS